MKIKNLFFDKRARIIIGVLCLVGFILFGWNGGTRSLPTPDTNNKATIDIMDPCQIALADHLGGSAIDRDIVHYQELSEGQRRPEAYLERLGWAYIAKARTSFDPGYFKLAQQTALCLDRKYPNSHQAQLLLGHVLHNLHQFKESEAIALALVENRGLWLDYGLLGDAQMEQGKLSDAVDAYQHMLDQRPGPQAYFRAAHMRWLKGDLPGAIDMMRMVIGAVGEKDKETAAWAIVKLAGYERQVNQTQAAEVYASRSLRLQPDYPPALLLRGEMLMGRKAYPAAVKFLSEAVRINPLPLYQWTYREALLQTGDFSQAEITNKKLLEKGAVLDRRSFALYLASTNQKAPTALALARQELDARQDVFTLDVMAWALRANGNLDEAHSFITRALAEGTVDGRLFYHAGVIADELGMRVLALRHYTNAISIKHVLLPSERQNLESKFATMMLQTNDLALNQ